MEKLIKMGAEANIYLDHWRGKEVVKKIRRVKPYWKEELDRKIRRIRTSREAEFITIVKKIGVLTPTIFFVDPFKGEIIMEYIDGIRVKDLLSQDAKKGYLMLHEAGKALAKMHMHNIIHGDPTTSNFIVKRDKLYLIDFGLAFHSTRLEDKSVDLHLLKQVMKSAHSEHFNIGYQSIVKGYESVYGAIRDILENIREIERRGRYAAPD
ncbi:MAG: KEOPS complex kinase/ATPase Bud32 [Nitrososphaeria archaeon]